MTTKEFGNAVRDAADEKGIKYVSIAKRLGMSRQMFYDRLLGNGWKLDEALSVIKMLDMPSDIFMQ